MTGAVWEERLTRRKAGRLRGVSAQRRHTARDAPVSQLAEGLLVLRERPDLTIHRRSEGVSFLVDDRPCEIWLRETTTQVGNAGASTDDSGSWPCGQRIRRDAVTALLFERPQKIRVTRLSQDRLRLAQRRRSSGYVYNTAVWDTESLEVVWDPGRRRVEVVLSSHVDTST
jgi:hypothetical protein